MRWFARQRGACPCRHRYTITPSLYSILSILSHGKSFYCIKQSLTRLLGFDLAIKFRAFGTKVPQDRNPARVFGNNPQKYKTYYAAVHSQEAALSVAVAPRPSLRPSVPCSRFYRNMKAVDTSNFVETWTRPTGAANVRSKVQRSRSLGTKM